MNVKDKEAISRNTHCRKLIYRFRAGINIARNNGTAKLLLLAILAVDVLLWLFSKTLFGLDNLESLTRPVNTIVRLALLIFYIISVPSLFVLIGTPPGSIAAREGLQRAGLTNSVGEVPTLVSKRTDKENVHIIIWEFEPSGIPLSEWEDKRERIEAAFHVIIVKIVWGEKRESICMYTIAAVNDIPKILRWRDEYISKDNFVLVLGKSVTGPVTVNLAHIPHILLGGSTGSGKSVLLKLLLMQAIKKGAVVCVADFKGGVDFSHWWGCSCDMVFTEGALLKQLDQMMAILEQRKRAFKEEGCPDLDTYNQKMGSHAPRFIFACDEVAELLDKTGADSERKKLLAQIENKLSTIARQGRAFGIHLILATQRPDATIIPGQIRNNMDFRVCGRADSVLSQIILDNTSAAEQIPKDARGRFITGDGTVFQGYLFDEGQL